MAGLASFAKRHPVLAYYVLVFVISWGGILIALGPGGFLGTTQSARTQLYIGGPISLLGPTIAGLLMTGLLYGRPGLRQLVSRLLKWRVGAGWYAFALLTAPIITTLSLLARATPPAIATADNKLNLLLTGILFGIVSSPIFEEIGWTGFVTPELRKRFSLLTTGVVMGLLWGLWHFPIFSASGRASAPLPPAAFTLVLLFTWLIPYRVLIVWLYDHTQSVLLAIIMHVPIVADQFILAPTGLPPTFTAASNLIFAAALWVVVIVVLAAERRREAVASRRLTVGGSQ
jgi:membrane protease YdiL (CAAX protease family)